MARFFDAPFNIFDSLRINSAEFKVTPEELSKQAVNVESGVAAIRSKFASAEQSVKNTVNYWNGDAADVFRAECEEYRDEIEEILVRISEHITDLRIMAGIYKEAETAAEEIIETLPSDLIV